MDTAIKAVHDYLPDSIHFLMTVISVDSALMLIKKHGGTHIEIPKTAKNTHYLANLIGMEDFKKLTGVFGCTALEIPQCTKLMTLARDIKILQDSRAGISQTKLAFKYRMSERSIRRALARIKQKDQGWLKELQASAPSIIIGKTYV